MIRIRSAIDRAVRHRWLGPIIVVVLVLLLAFVALHSTLDLAEVETGIALLCVALVALLVPRLLRAQPPADGRTARARAWRAPPTRTASHTPQVVAPCGPPLRL